MSLGFTVDRFLILHYHFRIVIANNAAYPVRYLGRVEFLHTVFGTFHFGSPQSASDLCASGNNLPDRRWGRRDLIGPRCPSACWAMPSHGLPIRRSKTKGPASFLILPVLKLHDETTNTRTTGIRVFTCSSLETYSSDVRPNSGSTRLCQRQISSSAEHPPQNTPPWVNPGSIHL